MNCGRGLWPLPESGSPTGALVGDLCSPVRRRELLVGNAEFDGAMTRVMPEFLRATVEDDQERHGRTCAEIQAVERNPEFQHPTHGNTQSQARQRQRLFSPEPTLANG